MMIVVLIEMDASDHIGWIKNGILIKTIQPHIQYLWWYLRGWGSNHERLKYPFPFNHTTHGRALLAYQESGLRQKPLLLLTELWQAMNVCVINIGCSFVYIITSTNIYHVFTSSLYTLGIYNSVHHENGSYRVYTYMCLHLSPWYSPQTLKKIPF